VPCADGLGHRVACLNSYGWAIMTDPPAGSVVRIVIGAVDMARRGAARAREDLHRNVRPRRRPGSSTSRLTSPPDGSSPVRFRQRHRAPDRPVQPGLAASRSPRRRHHRHPVGLTPVGRAGPRRVRPAGAARPLPRLGQRWLPGRAAGIASEAVPLISRFVGLGVDLRSVLQFFVPE
jgi:hypothetical protein